MQTTLVLPTPPIYDLDRLRTKLHVVAGSDDGKRLGEMVRDAELLGRPKAVFRTAFVDTHGEDSVVIDGITFNSRVLAVNLAQAYRVFPFAATCGHELATWGETFTDMVESYWADAIMEMALRAVTAAMRDEMSKMNPGQGAVMNPGSLPDWPLEEQRKLFALLGGVEKMAGVALMPSFLMQPIKSVSGIWFPTETTYENCQLCTKQDCPGRRAPYEAGLYESKYLEKK